LQVEVPPAVNQSNPHHDWVEGAAPVHWVAFLVGPGIVVPVDLPEGVQPGAIVHSIAFGWKLYPDAFVAGYGSIEHFFSIDVG
jgi:hypothetical protein